ncbi:short-chain dehydrogenase/reductase [Henriciella aquimarina]|uniref:short-chain dehydrogenase/reductase n=1 Tax=Henriciella aquimarina TaxID=545261 RepID=UPI000A0269B4|nr:short-chain dehydrogenase/reductase [Henriciella aquimarina]
MDLELDGKRALITGSTQGIGLAMATVLASEGADLVLVARSSTDLQAIKAKLSLQFQVKIETVSADLSTPSGIDTVANAIEMVDIIINNAGAIPPGSLVTVTSDAWRAAWDLKVHGYIELARELYPRLRKPGGVIINIIGAAGEQPNENYIAGCTGNAALMMFTRALARQAIEDGVRVVGINPGPVLTDRFRMLLRAEAERKFGDASRWEDLVKDLPFGRAAAPKEIADAAAFLASARSAYTTGMVMTINGGS